MKINFILSLFASTLLVSTFVESIALSEPQNSRQSTQSRRGLSQLEFDSKKSTRSETPSTSSNGAEHLMTKEAKAAKLLEILNAQQQQQSLTQGTPAPQTDNRSSSPRTRPPMKRLDP